MFPIDVEALMKELGLTDLDIGLGDSDPLPDHIVDMAQANRPEVYQQITK